MDLHIITECYIDTKLVKILVPPKTKYNHQKGCPNVESEMTKKLQDTFALGIVDKDKRELKYFNEFKLIVEMPINLQLLKHKSKHHYLIYICPAVEKWLISSAEMAHLSLTDFGLPHELEKLKKITKTSKSEEHDEFSSNFKALFQALKLKNPPTVAILAFWINYLKINPYTADLTYITQKTNEILG